MVDYKYADLFYRENTDKQAKIEYSGGGMTNTELFQNSEVLTESLCSEKELRFGCCEAASFKFKVANIVKPMTGEAVTFSIVVNHHETDPFLVGRYKVASDKETADRRCREIVAYDVMYDILNTDMAAWYNSILPEESSAVTLRQFRKDFIRHFGMAEVVPQGGLVNDGMTVERTINPEQISGKDIITAICEINGCFGHIGRDGKFHYIYLPQAIEGLYPANDLYPDHAPEWMAQAKTGHLYPQSPNSTRMGTGRYIKCEYEDYATKRIAKLQIRQKENDIGAVWPEEDAIDSDNCYIIEDNFLVYGKSHGELAVIAENVFSRITDIVYRPFSATCVGTPCMEVGDPVRFLTKYKIVESYILKRTMKGIQALRDTYTADGVEQYAEKLNGVQKSIVQLKGKTNTLERNIDETRLEMKDMGEGLSNTISATAGEIRGELQNAKAGLENQISVTAKGLEASIRDTKSSLETTIGATAEGIKSEVSQTYETKAGAQTQYNSLSTSIFQTHQEISAEVNRATAAEGNLSSQLQLLGGQIVLKADANGRMVLVELNANPATGSEFKVDADNISLSANDVMNLMAGGTLNLSAMNISITSNNWSVDAQGNMVCNNLSAVTFTGQAIDDLNNAIFNSETMRRMQEIVDLFDNRMVTMEQLLFNDKVLFDSLDDKNAYKWDYTSGQPKFVPNSALAPFVIIDGTGYTKCVVRVQGEIYGTPGGATVNNSYIAIGFSNDWESPDLVKVVRKWNDAAGGSGQDGVAYRKWYNVVLDMEKFTDKTKLPLNVFATDSAINDGGAVLRCSRISLTNN